MTVVVSVKVTDGIVLAADSAATFVGAGDAPFKIYNHANKIFNLVRGWPVGAMVYGSGGIGAASVETLTKDLRTRFQMDGGEYSLVRETYTVEDVAKKARKWLFEEHYLRSYPQPPADFFMGYRVCGYSPDAALAEAWEFRIIGADCDEPQLVQGQPEFGVRWAGENETLDRLLFGATGAIRTLLMEKGFSEEAADAFYGELIQRFGASLVIPSMPIQDAIEVARFAVETAGKFARYGMRPETIGGPTEVAAITKHEGFKWVARKHYYSADLNQETDHV